jgi:DNA repair protein RecO (recombination protein O)
MNFRKDTAIVLSSSLMGEADVLITVLTKDFGKRKFVIKGLKKSVKRSKIASQAGVVLNIDYNYYENKDYQTVKEFSITHSFPNIQNEYNKIIAMCFICEVCEKTTAYNEVNIKMFELVAAALTTLESSPNPVSVSCFFIIHALKLHGVLTEIHNCKKCGKKIADSFTFDLKDLNIVCMDCSLNRSHLISYQSIEFLNDSLTMKYADIPLNKFSDKTIADLLFYLCLFAEHYFNILLNSKKLLFSEALDA